MANLFFSPNIFLTKINYKHYLKEPHTFCPLSLPQHATTDHPKFPKISTFPTKKLLPPKTQRPKRAISNNLPHVPTLKIQPQFTQHSQKISLTTLLISNEKYHHTRTKKKANLQILHAKKNCATTLNYKFHSQHYSTTHFPKYANPKYPLDVTFEQKETRANQQVTPGKNGPNNKSTSRKIVRTRIPCS